MNDEPPSTPAAAPRSWLDRLGQMLSGEARNRDELLDELRSAKDNGLLSADTLAMIEGAIDVSDQQAGDVMVARSQMVTIPVDASLAEIVAIVLESGHSRFPVLGAEREQVVGILLAKDLLRCLAEPQRPCDIPSLIRPVSLVPESKRLNQLLKEFRTRRQHMAIVIDEYGGVAGLITIEDVLEEIVGDIDDEHDDEFNPDQHIRVLADGRFAVSALTPVELFNQRFGCALDEDEYDTIGGRVTEAFGYVPEVNEEIDIEGLHFVVTKADARRVLQFIVVDARGG